MDEIKKLLTAIEEYSSTKREKAPTDQPHIILTTPHFTEVKVYLKFLESADIYRYQQSKYTDIFKDGKLMLSVIETPIQIRYLVSVQEGRSDFDEDVFSTLGKRGLNPALVVARAKGVRLRLSSHLS